MARSYRQKRRAALATEARLYRQAQQSAKALSDKLAGRYGLLEKDLRRRWPKFLDSRPVLAYQRRALADDIGRWWRFLDPATQADLERILSGSVEASLALARKRFPDDKALRISPTAYVDTAMTAIEAALSRGEQRQVLAAAGGVEQGLAFGRISQVLRAFARRTSTEVASTSITTTYSAHQDAVVSMLQEQDVALVQWLTAGDDRVCPVCAARDMLVYRLEDIILPAHIRCRCVVVDVTLDELQGDEALLAEITGQRQDTLKALSEAGRKPNGGLTPAEKYEGRQQTAPVIWTP